MMKPNIVFGLINIVGALAIIGVSIPLVKRKIKMNRLYGIRIGKSFESEDNWYKINAYGGRQLIIWSIPMVLAGLICFVVPIDDRNKDMVALVLGVFPVAICITVAVIKIVAYARRV